MAEFPTFKGSWPWPWPWIGSYCIPPCTTPRPLPTIKFHWNRRNYLWTDGRTGRRTFETHFIRSTRKSRPKKGHMMWPRPFQGRFVICRLELAMFNPHTKFEVSTITCNKDMKGNAKYKNSHFEPPFGWLRGNAQGSSTARWKVHRQLPISGNKLFR